MNLFPLATRGALTAAVLVAAAAGAQAQNCPDWQLNGAQQSTDATTAWAPQRYSTTAGGPLNLSQCGTVPGHGYMNAAPSFTITYDAQDRGFDLDFRVESNCDTLLLINDATAEWHFNDDEDNTLNPRLRLADAGTGVYDVWVGTYGTQTCPATLVVETFPAAGPEMPTTPTEPTTPTPTPASACPEWSVGGAELSLSSGASETRDVVAGGAINLFESAQNCGIMGHGHVHTGPDFTLFYDAPNPDAELQIAASGECDTVLLVNDLNAQWLFNDDHDGLDPMISIPAAATGRYDIWIGTYGPDLCRGAVSFTSVAPPAPQLTK